MEEFVIGIGRQGSLRKVVDAVSSHITRIEGAAKTIKLRGPGIKVTAERPDFDVEFSRFQVRGRISDAYALKIQAKIDELHCPCTLLKDENSHVLTYPAAGAESSPEGLESLDQVTALMGFPETWRARGENFRTDPISIEMLFRAMIQYKASDIHLSPGNHPIFRVDGEMHHSELLYPLSGHQIREVIKEIASERYVSEFESAFQTSFEFHQVGLGFARVSAFIKSGAPHCTMRFLPEEIPSFEALNMPKETLVNLAGLHRGLLLITGMTGSGKSTTAAALVDWINSHRSCHILTIENPIEYVHHNKTSVVSQRSLGTDVATFDQAVTGALRHDPDVILIGEMRDPDTIRSAISAAATGHLVISTLHANTASEVVNRVVSFFDPVERDLVKLQLRDCLHCVICQRLVPKIGGGRVPALEVLFNDVKAITDGILEGDTDHIRIGMQQTVSHSFLFEQYLYGLYRDKKITLDFAREFASDVSMFDQIHMGTYSVPRLEGVRGH
ncbi:MAG: PilT/PilU family type 4a pilus ATPase [Candidatus Hydrogenedens sp.]|nr:PilT/PilU family type 4a pilus ATPase [Candidatus Hydrogenedens sp.]